MKKDYKGLILGLILISPLFTLNANSSSLTLEECIQYAWKNNTNISRYQNTFKNKTSSLEQSKAELLPDLNLSINQNLNSTKQYSNSDDVWTSKTNSTSSFNLSSSLTIYNGAKLLNAIKQSKINLQAAEYDTITQKDLLSLEVLENYINVLLAEEQYQNNLVQYETTQKQVMFAKAKKDSGVLSNSDYLNIKSQLATDKATLVSAESQLRINKVSLMQTINMPLQDSLSIEAPSIDNLLVNSIKLKATDIYEIAIDKRPEVKAAKLDLKSSNLEVKIAKADYLPSLKLNASINSNYSDDLSEVDFGDQFINKVQPAIGLTFSIPIFQKKKVINQIAQAKLSASNTELDLLDVENNLRKNIEKAVTDASVAKMNYEASAERLKAEEESFLLADKMFTEGLINSVDYLTSKENYIDAKSNFTTAKYSLLLTYKSIDYYLGNPITF